VAKTVLGQKFPTGFSKAPTDWQIDLEKAIESLPEDKRLVVTMFYMSDCSLKEISEYLGVSVNNVKVKLHRARQELGNKLERYGRVLSENKLKGGFIMQILEQIQNIPRPTMPPAWQRHLPPSNYNRYSGMCANGCVWNLFRKRSANAGAIR